MGRQRTAIFGDQFLASQNCRHEKSKVNMSANETTLELNNMNDESSGVLLTLRVAENAGICLS